MITRKHIMKKYFILLSGLYFSQIQGMVPTVGAAPKTHNPSSLFNLAFKQYRANSKNNKVKYKDIQDLGICKQELMRDEFLKEDFLIKCKGYKKSRFFPFIKLKHQTKVTAVAFAMNSPHFAVGEESGQITIYDLLGNEINRFIVPSIQNAPRAIIHLEFTRINGLILVSKIHQAPQLIDTNGKILVNYVCSYDKIPNGFIFKGSLTGDSTSHLSKLGMLEKSLAMFSNFHGVIGAYYNTLDVPNFIKNIIDNHPFNWVHQETLIARFSGTGDYIIGTNVYNDKNIDLHDLNHHIKDDHWYKSLQVWDVFGNLLSINSLKNVDQETPIVKLTINAKLTGVKRYINEHDIFRTTNKTGEYALSVHENKVFLQSIIIGSISGKFKVKDLTLEELFFLDKSGLASQAAKHADKIDAQQKEENEKCTIS